MTAPVNLTGVRKQPMNRAQLNHVFTDRYPTLSDLLAHGGVPGIRYVLAHVNSLNRLQSQEGWDMVARLTNITIRITQGQKAGDHTAFLLCNGRPIPGASTYNGVRDYRIDPVLDEATGLGPAPKAESSKATPALRERTAS